MSDLLIPGRRRGKELEASLEMETLAELYHEYHHSACGPFKMMRLDRYFFEIERVRDVYMQQPKGGGGLDNRRRSVT